LLRTRTGLSSPTVASFTRCWDLYANVFLRPPNSIHEGDVQHVILTSPHLILSILEAVKTTRTTALCTIAKELLEYIIIEHICKWVTTSRTTTSSATTCIVEICGTKLIVRRSFLVVA